MHAIVGGTPGGILRYLLKGRGLAKKRGKRFVMVEQRTTVAELELLMEMAVKGTIKPVVDSVFGLEEVRGAFERFGGGQFVGKVVVEMGQG